MQVNDLRITMTNTTASFIVFSKNKIPTNRIYWKRYYKYNIHFLVVLQAIRDQDVV